VHVVIIFATLGFAEVILRVVDFRELRDGYQRGHSAVFRYDPELGWSPIPNAAAEFHGSRTITVQHNSLGLRDVEPDATSRPTVLFLGDSFVWGYDVEANERFTELLRKDLPGTRIVSAGVPGYGTDQEYLLLKRIWSAIQPDVVVLMFCVANDRDNNTSNVDSAGHFKPYLERAADGAWRFAGQPVPRPRHAYFNDNALVHNLWLARLAVLAFVEFRYRKVAVADPTEHLVGLIRDFVEAQGAKFLVGLQNHEPQLEAFLQTQKIRYTSFDGAESYSADGAHWTPNGHALVASRLASQFGAGVADIHPAQVPGLPGASVSAIRSAQAPSAR